MGIAIKLNSPIEILALKERILFEPTVIEADSPIELGIIKGSIYVEVRVPELGISVEVRVLKVGRMLVYIAGCREITSISKNLSPWMSSCLLK